MMKITVNSEIELMLVECYFCGTVFGMSSILHRRFKDTGETMYCPNGHGQVFGTTRQQQIDALKRQLTYTENDRDWYKKQLSSTKGQLTKTKNRIANGVCPCCHRQFVQLGRHMKTKHPDYIQDES